MNRMIFDPFPFFPLFFAPSSLDQPLHFLPSLPLPSISHFLFFPFFMSWETGNHSGFDRNFYDTVNIWSSSCYCNNEGYFNTRMEGKGTEERKKWHRRREKGRKGKIWMKQVVWKGKYSNLCITFSYFYSHSYFESLDPICKRNVHQKYIFEMFHRIKEE